MGGRVANDEPRADLVCPTSPVAEDVPAIPAERQGEVHSCVDADRAGRVARDSRGGPLIASTLKRHCSRAEENDFSAELAEIAKRGIDPAILSEGVLGDAHYARRLKGLVAFFDAAERMAAQGGPEIFKSISADPAILKEEIVRRISDCFPGDFSAAMAAAKTYLVEDGIGKKQLNVFFGLSSRCWHWLTELASDNRDVNEFIYNSVLKMHDLNSLDELSDLLSLDIMRPLIESGVMGEGSLSLSSLVGIVDFRELMSMAGGDEDEFANLIIQIVAYINFNRDKLEAFEAEEGVLPISIFRGCRDVQHFFRRVERAGDFLELAGSYIPVHRLGDFIGILLDEFMVDPYAVYDHYKELMLALEPHERLKGARLGDMNFGEIQDLFALPITLSVITEGISRLMMDSGYLKFAIENYPELSLAQLLSVTMAYKRNYGDPDRFTAREAVKFKEMMSVREKEYQRAFFAPGIKAVFFSNEIDPETRRDYRYDDELGGLASKMGTDVAYFGGDALKVLDEIRCGSGELRVFLLTHGNEIGLQYFARYEMLADAAAMREDPSEIIIFSTGCMFYDFVQNFRKYYEERYPGRTLPTFISSGSNKGTVSRFSQRISASIEGLGDRNASISLGEFMDVVENIEALMDDGLDPFVMVGTSKGLLEVQ